MGSRRPGLRRAMRGLRSGMLMFVGVICYICLGYSIGDALETSQAVPSARVHLMIAEFVLGTMLVVAAPN